MIDSGNKRKPPATQGCAAGENSSHGCRTRRAQARQDPWQVGGWAHDLNLQLLWLPLGRRVACRSAEAAAVPCSRARLNQMPCLPPCRAGPAARGRAAGLPRGGQHAAGH